MLCGRGVSLSFGGLAALRDVDFDVHAGEIVGLLGPNGSGKSSLFNLISGLRRPTGGRLTFLGHNICRLPPHRITHLGVGRTFQLVRPFPALNVLHNVMGSALFGQQLRSRVAAERVAHEVLALVELTAYAEQAVADVPLVIKKRLEVARALATGPRLLLLDEVFSGLNPVEIAGAIQLIFRIRDELGITVLMIEHVMPAVMHTCERVIVLSGGQKVSEGPPKAVVHDPVVRLVYLGDTDA